MSADTADLLRGQLERFQEKFGREATIQDWLARQGAQHQSNTANIEKAKSLTAVSPPRR